jgi:hypothetical protein
MLQLLVLSLQNIQWAIDCDLSVIDNSLANAQLPQCIESIVTKFFTVVNCQMEHTSCKGGSEAVNHVKERRYVSKILTITLRDFPQALVTTNVDFMLQTIW